MQAAPKGMRLHIALFGRRNVGKSSLLNAITRQAVSIVSDVAGTTTDPVEKPMELLPIGPVLFIDTAGIDDVGALGEQRVARTRAVLDRTEVGVIVAAAGEWSAFEQALLTELRQRNTPALVVFNKADVARPSADLVATLQLQQVPVIETIARATPLPSGEKQGGAATHSTPLPSGERLGEGSAVRPKTLPLPLPEREGGLMLTPSTGAALAGVAELRAALLRIVPEDFLAAPTILGDLIPPGGLAVLVVPIDKEAPKGRLIMPQVQSIRDLLDNDAYCMVVKERELRDALDRLKAPPDLVVTDSQAFLKVAADTPPAVPMTSFSILFARFKGDLLAYTRGARAIDTLRPGDRVLVAEACSHHPIGEDIGRVKIPRWLTQYVGGKLDFTHVQGHDFPADPSGYKLVVHCGACTQNRREVLTRIERCRAHGVPMTNYGVAIAYSLGILERALSPFPAVVEAYRQSSARA